MLLPLRPTMVTAILEELRSHQDQRAARPITLEWDRSLERPCSGRCPLMNQEVLHVVVGYY